MNDRKTVVGGWRDGETCMSVVYGSGLVSVVISFKKRDSIVEVSLNMSGDDARALVKHLQDAIVAVS